VQKTHTYRRYRENEPPSLSRVSHACGKYFRVVMRSIAISLKCWGVALAWVFLKIAPLRSCAGRSSTRHLIRRTKVRGRDSETAQFAQFCAIISSSSYRCVNGSVINSELIEFADYRSKSCSTRAFIVKLIDAPFLRSVLCSLNVQFYVNFIKCVRISRLFLQRKWLRLFFTKRNQFWRNPYQQTWIFFLLI